MARQSSVCRIPNGGFRAVGLRRRRCLRRAGSVLLAALDEAALAIIARIGCPNHWNDQPVSYDIYLEVAAAQLAKRRRGAFPEAAVQRMARAVEVLRQLDPGLACTRDEALAEVSSDVYGTLLIDCNRVSATFRSGASYREILHAIRRLLLAFEPEGYTGYDRQLGHAIRPQADMPGFLRQFRAQVRCTEEEFEIWVNGAEPPTWRDRREREEAYERRCRLAFPRVQSELYHHELVAMDAAALEREMDRVIAANDATIAIYGLGEMFDYRLACGCSRIRRATGAWIPDEDWVKASALGYEARLAGYLRGTGAQRVIFDQPQELTVHCSTVPIEQLNERMREVGAFYRLLEAQLTQIALSQPANGWSGGGDGFEMKIDTADVEVLYQQLLPFLRQHRPSGELRVVRRYGWYGAPEIEEVI